MKGRKIEDKAFGELMLSYIRAVFPEAKLSPSGDRVQNIPFEVYYYSYHIRARITDAIKRAGSDSVVVTQHGTDEEPLVTMTFQNFVRLIDQIGINKMGPCSEGTEDLPPETP